MRIVIVDDEPLARDRLRALLADMPDCQIVAEADDGHAALEVVEQHRPDLVLLDISMPRMDGLEAATHLAGFDAAPAVIFCTAYDQHALAAFEAHAVDYLLKPIRADRLAAAIDRARRYVAGIEPPPAATMPTRQRTHLCARVRGNLVLVPVSSIRCLVAEDKYVVVHHDKGQVLVEDALKSLEDEFGERFVRIHRNCLVALEYLSGLARSADGRVLASVPGVDVELEISRRNLPSIRSLVRAM